MRSITGSYVNLRVVSPAALCGQLLVLAVCGRSIPIWHQCVRLGKRNAGRGGSGEPVYRRLLVMVSYASCVEVSAFIAL